jgi:hypothetical protein
MNQTLKYAMAAVLASALAAPAFAQSTNFPDAPENHWAYEALGRMKQEGLLVGYPDGLFRGSRLATRYELAVAMDAVWMNLKAVTDGLNGQIKALEDKEGTDSADIANLKSEVDGIKSDLAAMKGWGDDIAALKKAADTFTDEFKAMGVDVNAMKTELASYGDRITALEKVKLPFVVSGDLNFVGLAGYGYSNGFGITPDGRLTGISHNVAYSSDLAEGAIGYGGHYVVGADKDLSLYGELGINIASPKDDASKVAYGATVVVGNTLATSVSNPGTGFGNQSSSPTLVGYTEGNESVYVDRAWVKFNTKLASVDTDVTIGRQGHKIDALLYKRPDTAWFYNNPRWSNGEWTYDGLDATFKAGPAKITLFGGRTSDNSSIGAINGGSGSSELLFVQPLMAGRIHPEGYRDGSSAPLITIDTPSLGDVFVDNELGLQAGVPIGANGKINLAYLWLASDQFDPSLGNPQPDGVRVYGGDATFHYAGFRLNGAYGKSDVYQGGSDIVDRDNDAWWVSLSKKIDIVNLKAGYEYIAPLYGAPGDWGRIGTWWNPTDIQGWNASARVKLTPTISLDGKGQWVTGTGQGKTLPFGGETNPTDATFADYQVTLKYHPGPYEASVGFETVHAALPGAVSEYENWYNLGFGWNASENAKVSLLWQISNANLQSGYVFRGGLIGTQLTVKF